MDKISLPPKWSQPLSENPSYCTNSPACKIHATCDGGCPGPAGKAYGMPAIDPQPASSATQNQDQGPMGLCNCPRASGCSCAWGGLIADLCSLAYRVPRDKALVELPHVQMQLVAKLADLRREALQRRATEWTGTVNEFLKAFELTRSNLDRLEIKVRRPD